MTALELQTRVLERLGENPSAPMFYTSAHALAWLNAAQRLMVLLTLCLETTNSFPISSNAYYSMLTIFPDWLLPLRIRSQTGVKLKPCRFADLAALDTNWNASIGNPQRYAIEGFDLLGVYQQPTQVQSLSVTYARCPDPLVVSTDVPEVPLEYHPALADGAIPLLRAREGGKEFQKVLPLWDRFIEACTKLGAYVRQRNKEQGYDYLPIELQRADKSRTVVEQVQSMTETQFARQQR